MSTDELTIYIIDNYGHCAIKPDGSPKKGFMLNVNYRDVIDAIDAILPFKDDGSYKKCIEVQRKTIMSVILTRHVSSKLLLKRVAYLLNVSSHALIVHYRRQHDKKMQSIKLEDRDYQRSFAVVIDTLSFQSDKNKQRIDNLLSGKISP
jgi:hypothetical protein